MSDLASDYVFFSNPVDWIDDLLNEFDNAKSSICIEIFRFAKDQTGLKILNSLIYAASRGVLVKLLIDAYGSVSALSMFEPLIKIGGQVRIFQAIRITPAFFTQSHKRDHRKIILIDDDVAYIGSANFSHYSLSWRESILKVKGKSFQHALKYAFSLNFECYKKYNFGQKKHIRVLKGDGFDIIRDIPSIVRQRVKRKMTWLVNNAKDTIYIETPYFLPGFMLRHALMDAAHRGVNVNIIMPKHSDVRVVDILRNKYLGQLYLSGVNLLYYDKGNLHSKIMIIDDTNFVLGSSNVDYRSFRYMYEIVISGINSHIIKLLDSHAKKTYMFCIPFNFQQWKNRSFIDKLLESFLVPFRHLL